MVGLLVTNLSQLMAVHTILLLSVVVLCPRFVPSSPCRHQCLYIVIDPYKAIFCYRVQGVC